MPSLKDVQCVLPEDLALVTRLRQGPLLTKAHVSSHECRQNQPNKTHEYIVELV